MRAIKFRGLGVGKMGEGSQKVQTSSYKVNKSWDVIYSMVTIVNNTVLYIWRLLRDYILKVLITRKKNNVWWCLLTTYCGDHFAMNTNI